MLRSIRWRELGCALVWACATFVATWFVSLPTAAIVAAWGGFLGYLLGCLLSGTNLRLAPAVALSFALWGFSQFLSGLVSDNYALASMLGAENSFIAAQWLCWGGQALGSVFLLRFLSGRQPALITAEILSVTLLLASPLAAHRQGYINRPYFLVDPLWSQNLDPIPVLFGLGALAAGLLVILQNGRRTRRASWLDLVLLFLLIAVLYAILPNRQLLDFDIRDPLGLGKKKQEQKAKEDAEKKAKEAAEAAKKDKGKGGGRSEAEEMELDKPQNKDQKQKQKPVAIVLLTDDYKPTFGYYYFRQTAFSQYNGKRLVEDTTGTTDRDLLRTYPTSGETLTIETSVPVNSPYHSLLRTTVAMIEGHTKPFTLVDGRSATSTENPNPQQFVRAYEAESQVLKVDYKALFGLKAGDPNWDEKTWKHYTELPDDPRYKDLAEKCLKDLPPQYRDSDFARALIVKLWMDKTVTYTMKASHEGVPDPVADYLFVNPRGYCVHQAHAAVYLWRSLGIPSRVGAGYATDARNRGNGSAVLLRSGEAHAWPEVYLDGAGWVTLDISPEKHEGGEVEEPDPNLQRLLGELARAKEKKPAAEEKAFRKINLQEVMRFLLLMGWRVFKWTFLFGFIGNYLYKFYRRFEPLWAGPKRLPVAALRSGQDQLAEVGVVRAYGEGRLAFARRTELEALEGLTHWHLAAVLGGKTPNAKELLQLREQLHQQIARRYPAWRRLLGFINPLSWWSSR
ncbi:MAG: transglutaminase domain-containing protein [Candidatus Eremiobacteraeota bacterium]|nr:transglutaminase domain-containing protein [Candidatus Eremiobacteraeota bacterium]